MGARSEKAMALERYKVGDFSGAKVSAFNAMMMNPFLNGVTRLNTVLDVLLCVQKKINREVDWHAVLSVDPRADIATIQRRNKELLLFIIMDDGDNSLGSRTDEAKKILDDCRRYFAMKTDREFVKSDVNKEQIMKSNSESRAQARVQSRGGSTLAEGVASTTY